MASKVPERNDKYIPHLLNKIGTNNAPMIIKVIPEKEAKLLDCFMNVEKKVNNEGGKGILGWQFWKTDILMEAEFHAVWESEKKELLDITPKGLPRINHILFVIDERLIYEEKQKDNFRINITDNKLVDDFIEISKAIFNFENKGERAYQYELKLSESENRKYEELRMLKKLFLHMIKMKANEASPCVCGSGKKFKNCHGRDLRINLNRLQ